MSQGSDKTTHEEELMLSELAMSRARDDEKVEVSEAGKLVSLP